MPKVKTAFRLEERTKRQLVKLAANLHTTQTEAIEMGVQLLANQYLPSETTPPGFPLAAPSADEALARKHEEVAEAYASDPHLSQSLKDAVWRVHMATADNLRRGG